MLARKVVTGRTLGMGLLAGLVLAESAFADVRAVGRYRDWRVYTEQVGNDTVCFAAVDAEDVAPKNVEHGEVTFYVANWKSGSGSNQPSLKVGYALRGDRAPEAVIGRNRFSMYAAGNEAFVDDSKERALVDALKKGAQLRVEAAEENNLTAYHFSLRGSADAITKARSICR